MGFRATVAPVMVDSILVYRGLALIFVERSIAAIKLRAGGKSSLSRFPIGVHRALWKPH